MKYILTVGLLFTAVCEARQSEREDALEILDPARKVAAGFKANEVIYEIPSTNQAEQDNDQLRGGGGGFTSYQSYMGVESRGREGTFTYDTVSGAGDIYRTGGDTFADILLEVPNNNEFEFVRIWGYDSNGAEDMSFFLFERCLPAFSAGPIDTTTLGTVDSNTSGGDFSALITVPAGTFVDNEGCTYTLRTRFDTSDNTLRLYKVRAQSNLPL